MTAPGQEPDEVLTGKPGGKEDPTESLNLGAVGDSHMPEDVREAVREEAADRAAKSESDEPGDAENSDDTET
ncbi:MAG TPA: hypothetical protein VK964_18340 [Nocardioidaceae bacterium]|nr:hypothetical protein [Nocardioidaceae bacterium]